MASALSVDPDSSSHQLIIGQDLDAEPQILLILVGLPGSGKSTFAESLVRHSCSAAWRGQRRWTRASQDEAPNRRRQECEAMVRDGLRMGCHVVVDRVGFDGSQRAHFVDIADTTTPRPRLYCLILLVSLRTLETRLRLRPSHPTLPDPETAIRVLRQMTRQFSPPKPDEGEGFGRIFSLPEDQQPPGAEWSLLEAQVVLERIHVDGNREIGRRRAIARSSVTSTRGRGGGHGGYREAYRPPYKPPAYRPYQQSENDRYASYRPAYQPNYPSAYQLPSQLAYQPGYSPAHQSFRYGGSSGPERGVDSSFPLGDARPPPSYRQ